MYAAKKSRVLRVEARRRPAVVAVADRSPWDWYAESCPCGLPPGDCRAHPRARPSQRPPPSDWRVWAYVAGRGAGKTRAGACWVQHRAEAGVMRVGCLIAPTKADIRDVMVEGPSGLLAVAPPWCRPRFEPSKRRVVWPTGAWAVCLSGEEPERARGLNVDTLWADELACWQRAESTWDLAMLALRAGTDPQGHDHHNAPPGRGLETHPRRGDHQADDRHHLRQPGPPAAPVPRADRRACMRTPGWAGRRSTPSSSRPVRGSGSRGSTRPGMSRTRPNTTPSTTSAARSTPARRGTRRRCSFRFATIMARGRRG